MIATYVDVIPYRANLREAHAAKGEPHEHGTDVMCSHGVISAILARIIVVKIINKYRGVSVTSSIVCLFVYRQSVASLLPVCRQSVTSVSPVCPASSIVCCTFHLSCNLVVVAGD